MSREKTISMVNFPFLSVKVKGKRKVIHNAVLRDLIEALYRKGYRILWYDHIDLDVPKMKHPIAYKNRLFDIVAQGGDYLIFIEVKTKKINEKDREVIEKYGGG